MKTNRERRDFRPCLDRLDDRCLLAAGLRLTLGSLGPGQAANDARALSGRLRSATYAVHLDTSMALSAALTNIRGRVDLDLFAGGNLVAGSHNRGGDERVAETLGPGDYALRVSRSGPRPARFTLGVVTQPIAAPVGGQPGETARGLLVYDIAFSGTAYAGSTAFLGGNTTFQALANFGVGGVLVVARPVDSLGLFANGANPVDALLVTGGGPLGGAGSVEFATNSALHQLAGGNFISAANEDDAYVALDSTRRHLVIDVDSGLARTQQLNTLSVQGGDAHRIIAGRLTIDFHDDGTLSGSLTFYGESIVIPGTSAISATFSGRLRG
jgi:hypothetical protein